MTTTEQHPITPPPKLVLEWLNEFHAPCPAPGLAPGETALHIAAVAARWGADQELEACCAYISRWFANPKHRVAELRAARRPKPPTLAEQALTLLDDASTRLDAVHENTIRHALERLQELEQLND